MISLWDNAYPTSIMPVLPNDTRWKSQHDCLDSFLKNRPYYTAILNDHADELDKTICNKILDEAIDRTDLRDQLKPVAVALDRCQSNSATIADSCQSVLEFFSLNHTKQL